MNSEINIKFDIDKTTLRLLVILAALVALIIIGSRSVGAQEVADTIRINTRVVFMDALMKDKCAYDVDAHHHCAFAIKHVGRHQCAMFGKRVRQKAWIAMLL